MTSPPTPTADLSQSTTMPSKRASSPTADGGPGAKRFKYDATITILAGPEELPFIVHKNAIREKSPFFASACSENWKEGQENIVKLPSIEPDVIDKYIQWVYKDQLLIQVDFEQNLASEIYGLKEATYREHVELYLAAGFLLDDPLKIRIVDSLRLTFTSSGGGEFMSKNIAKVWQNTSEDCGLQRLMVDVAASKLPAGFAHTWLQKHSREFAVALATRLTSLKGRPTDTFNPNFVDKCYYHDHKEGEECLPHSSGASPK